MTRGQTAVAVLTLGSLFAGYAWLISRPTQPADVFAAEECRAAYGRAESAGGSSVVDRHRVDMGRRSGEVLHCGDLRARGVVDTPQGQ